jgi:TolA-binding protein
VSDEHEPLFKAWDEAVSRSAPTLDPRVRQRVLNAQAEPSRQRVFPAAYRWALAGGAAVAVAVAVLLLLQKPETPSFQVAGQSVAVGAWLTAEPARPLALRFSEGTRVSLGQGSRARVSGVTRGGARIELARGAVNAEVAHLPGANWSFGAGPFEVAVTGTQLGVSWAPDTGKFELSVISGSVLVKGPFIQGLQAVQAGQICRVDVPHRLMELGTIAAADAASSEGAAPAPTPAAPTATSAPEPASTAGSSSAAAVRTVSADALLETARAARLAGRRNEERAALLACRKHAPGQPAAAQAAYLLGRASSAAEAARWFETYLHEQPQGLLAREAAGRLIESYGASGNTSAAHAAASRYLAHYPNGPHASLARQTLARRSESQD